MFLANLAGFGTILIALIAYRILAGTWDFLKLIEGADGRPSSSKLQFFLWTLTVFFSYGALLGARFNAGQLEPISEIPPNLLIAMGLSVGTVTIAKGITTASVASGKEVKPPSSPSTGGAGLGALVNDDQGFPALNKIQMLTWTVLGVIVYIVAVEHQIDYVPTAGGALGLPDIDSSLMALMGLGNAAYIGKKLTTSTPTARLAGVAPSAGTAATDITLSGASFGAAQDGSQITLDGKPVQVTTTWTDSSIRFKLPQHQPDGQTAWSAGQRVEIGLIVGGRPSANTVPFTVS